MVLALSYSGETLELNGLLASLKERAVKIIAMTGGLRSTLAGYAELVLNVSVPREACPLGLAPTSSTTATLALGDALAIALLKRKQFKAEDFRRNHPGGSLGDRLKVAVREVMLTGDKVPVVDEQAPVDQALLEINAKNIGAVLVVAATGELKGIVTDGDIRRLLTTDRGRIEGARLFEVMTSDPVRIGSDLMAADALSLMQNREITILAVVDHKDRLQGILHLHDLLGKGEFRFLI